MLQSSESRGSAETSGDPELDIFGSLMDGTLWRPADSGRQIVLDWLNNIARNTLATCTSSNKQERREKFRQGLAEETLDNEKHPSKVIACLLILSSPSLR